MENNDKNRVPKLRYPGYTDPWVLRKLGEVIDVSSVKRIHQSEWSNSGVRFLRARDIVSASKNKIPKDALYISVEKYKKYSKISGKVEKEDLLVTGVGSIGVPLLITNDKPLYFKDGNIIWFKNQHRIQGDFLYYSFISDSIQRYIQKNAGIGTVSTYTINSGKKTPIFLPQYNEQKSIGSLFKNLDELIVLQQRKIEHLRKRKAGLLQKMFPKDGADVPEVRFPEYTDAWVQQKLEELLDKSNGLRRGPFGSALKKEFFVSKGKYTVYEQNNAINNIWKTRYFINQEKFQELHKFQLMPGDFILSGAGTIGRIAQVPYGITKGVFNQALIRIRINPEYTNEKFFLIWMQSEKMQRKLTQANPGSAMTNLVPMSEIKKWEIMVPRKTEQKKIGEFIQKINSLITLQQRKLEHLELQKRGLLQQMFV